MRIFHRVLIRVSTLITLRSEPTGRRFFYYIPARPSIVVIITRLTYLRMNRKKNRRDNVGGIAFFAPRTRDNGNDN